MKLLLVGGTGFFGKSLFSYFSKNDLGIEKITVLSRHPEKLNDFFDIKDFPFQLEYFAQDICEPIKLNKSMDYVIHAAAESSTPISVESPMLIRDVVVEGTKNVLEFVRKHKVKRMLFISSGAVYGKQPSDLSRIHEDYQGAPDPLNPLNAYGCAKRQAENLCALYHYNYGVEYVIARCFAFIGPYLPLDAHFAIGNFIRDGLNGSPILVKGDGTTLRSYLYSDDLAEWLWRILTSGRVGKAYNVGSDKVITIADLAHLVSSCFDYKPEVLIKGKPYTDRGRYIPRVDDVKSELGVSEKVTLVEGIQKKIAFHTK